MCEVEAMFTKLHECMVNLLTQRGQHSYLMPTISIFSSTYYTIKMNIADHDCYPEDICVNYSIR